MHVTSTLVLSGFITQNVLGENASVLFTVIVAQVSQAFAFDCQVAVRFCAAANVPSVVGTLADTTAGAVTFARGTDFGNAVRKRRLRLEAAVYGPRAARLAGFRHHDGERVRREHRQLPPRCATVIVVHGAAQLAVMLGRDERVVRERRPQSRLLAQPCLPSHPEEAVVTHPVNCQGTATVLALHVTVYNAPFLFTMSEKYSVAPGASDGPSTLPG